MKRRSAFLTSLALMAATLVYAGDAARMPVAGDRLRLNALSGFESMTGSCDSVYDFSRTSVGRAIERKYIYQSDSTVYELEQGQSRVLLMRGDAAWLSSEGRPGTLMRAAAPRPMPFAVPADSMQGGFDYSRHRRNRRQSPSYRPVDSPDSASLRHRHARGRYHPERAAAAVGACIGYDLYGRSARLGADSSGRF